MCLAPAGCGLVYRHQIKQAMQTPATSGQARLEVHDGVPVVHLYGTAEEMAAQYGRLLKPALQALCNYAKAVLPQPAMVRFVDYAKAQEPMLDEQIGRQLRVVAENAEIPHEYVLALNIVPRIRCTTLAVWGSASADGSMIMGRNADYFGLGLADRGSLVVVWHSRDEIPVVAVSFLGMIGAFSGMNAEGVAFGNMLVFNSTDPSYTPGGMPVQLAMRMAAHRSKDAESMARNLTAMKHAIPMNVMVADSSQALVLELGAYECCVRRGEPGVLAASNDFLAHSSRVDEDRCARYNALMSAVAEHRGQMGVSEMKQALYAARIPTMNIQAVVFEPAAMRMHVSINKCPAAAGPYRAFELRELLGE